VIFSFIFFFDMLYKLQQRTYSSSGSSSSYVNMDPKHINLNQEQQLRLLQLTE